MARRSHHGDPVGEEADADVDDVAYDDDAYDDDAYDDDAYDDDAYDEADDDEDGNGTETPVRPSLGDRIRSGLQPGGANKSVGRDQTTSPRSSKQIVERLDDRERLFCFAAAALAVVAGIAIYVVETENKNFRLTKGELTPETTLVLGFVVGGLLLGATLLGRRAPVGFVALFGFLFFGTRYFAGIPFLVLAVWLLVRSYKFQKEAAATRKAALADGTSAARSGTRGARGAASASTRCQGLGQGQCGQGPEPARGQQALHAQAGCSPSSEAHPARTEGGTGLGLMFFRQWDSVTRADRSRSKISVRRRTSERAVGSSPKARNTSTSVTMPMTVE